MKPVLYAVLFLGLVTPSFSAMPIVDFDGKKANQDFATFLREESPEITIPATQPTDNYEPVRKPGIIDENGEFTPLEPVKRWRGEDGIIRTQYQYWPTQKISWSLECKGTSQPTWSAKQTYTFTSDQSAGHHHYDPLPPSLKVGNVVASNSTVPPDTEFYPKPSPFYFPSMSTNVKRYYWEWMPTFATTLVEEFQSFGACTGTQIDMIDVKVPNLVEMKSGTGYIVDGDTAEHPATHFVTPDFKAQLLAIAATWKQTCPSSIKPYPLTFLQMSLPWGGLFDINDNWNAPHSAHRYGNNADISKWRVRKGNRAKLVKMMCEYAHVYSEGDGAKENPHYHLALRTSKHADDIPNPLDTRYQYCCPTPMPDVPQVCIDLETNGNPSSEHSEVPVETDCP